jgi:iron complex outermembrane receptor protein
MKNSDAQMRMGLMALVLVCSTLFASARGQTLNLPLEIRSDNPEVVITSNRQAQHNINIPAMITVITREQIQDSGAANVNDAVMKLAGVIGTPSLFGGGEYSLDLAGFGDTSSSNTVFVVDGMPLRESDQSEIRISSIPLDSVERIEIQRGSANVLYGEGATAGVINIITRASTGMVKNAQTGTAALSLGSLGAQEVRANLSKSFDAVEIHVAAMDARADGYRDHSRSQTRSGQLGFKVNSGGVRWGLNFSREDVNAQTPGALTLAEFKANPRKAQSSSVLNDTQMKMNLDRQSLFAEVDMGNFTLKADLAHKTRVYDAIAVLYGSRTPLNFDTSSDYLGLSARNNSQWSGISNSLIFGIDSTQWDQSRLYPSQPLWGTVLLDSQTHSFYVKNETDLPNSGLRFSVGWREESFKRHQFFAGVNSNLDERLQAWELGLSKTITADQSVYVRYTQGYRVPNLDEFTTPAYDVSGAVNLVPQTDRTREMGWKYFASTKSSAGVRFYQTSLRNEIIYDPAQYGNINLESTRRQGADLHANHAVHSKVNLSASLGLRQSTLESGPNAGKYLPLAARQVAGLRAEWTPNENHKLGLGWMYVGRQYISGDFVNEQAMPSYALLDFRYGFKTGAWELSAVVRNLTDKKYYSYATTTDGYSVYSDPGRSLLLTARSRF